MFLPFDRIIKFALRSMAMPCNFLQKYVIIYIKTSQLIVGICFLKNSILLCFLNNTKQLIKMIKVKTLNVKYLLSNQVKDKVLTYCKQKLQSNSKFVFDDGKYVFKG